MIKIKDLRQHPRLVFTAVAVACLAVQVLYLFLQTPISDPPSLSARVLVSLFDAAVIFSPFLFLRRRMQWLVLVPFIILPLLILANVLYLRNFGDILAPVLYYCGTPFDPLVLRSAADSLKPVDLLLPLASLVAFCAFLALRKRIYPSAAARGFRRAYLASLAAGLLLCGTMIYRRYGKWEEDFSPRTIYGCLFIDKPRTWKPYFYHQGLLWYAGRCLLEAFNAPGKLSVQERRDVSAFFRQKVQEYAPLDSLSGPVPLNLVYIIVESWSARLFDTDEGRAVMPNIMALSELPSSILLPDLYLQAGIGRSADGQFIYNTGLLPLQSEPYAFTYAFKPYPSLARAFGGNAAEVIGEDAVIWSHKATNESFGFSKLVDHCATGSDALGDSLIFRAAARTALDMREPFYLEITTLSMHDPYTESGVPDTPDTGRDIDPRDRNYLARVSFFDRHLGHFISQLKASGLYDRTLIVIASDHEVRDICISPYLQTCDIPALILNSPKTPVPEGRYRQVDLFPTVLDLLGLETEGFGTSFRGVGTSIFDAPGEPRDTVMARERRISELIIRNE